MRVHELYIVLGVNTDQKSRVGNVCSPKNFFEFWEPVKVRNFGNFVVYGLTFGFASDRNTEFRQESSSVQVSDITFLYENLKNRNEVVHFRLEYRKKNVQTPVN